MIKTFLTILSITLALTCMAKPVTVGVANDNGFDVDNYIIELDADSLRQLLGAEYVVVSDADGREVVSQLTHDGSLIFPATVGARSQATYTLTPSDTLPACTAVVWGRIYPERADDIAWENELGGYRIYGPATQAKGEKAYGYDIFFKHQTQQLVLPQLYALQTDPRGWRIADSLRKIDRKLANEYIDSHLSYHVDHGLGMDCYAVGPTLGDGVAALIDSSGIHYPWCYSQAEILDNGPLRFTVRLDFAPTVVGADSAVVEHRIVSLDSNSPLNRCRVWYDGLSADNRVAVGFPRRDDSEAVKDSTNSIIVYSDPTQGKNNGRALLGLIADKEFTGIYEVDNHIAGIVALRRDEPLNYHWGFSWGSDSPVDKQQWHDRLLQLKELQRHPLRIRAYSITNVNDRAGNH